MSNSSIWPIDRILSGATTLGQSGPGSDGNEGVLYIPQISSITGALPSDCLVLYPGQLVVEVGVLPLCIDAYSITPKLQHYWRLTISFLSVISGYLLGVRWGGVTPLQRCIWRILQPQSTGLRWTAVLTCPP